MTPREAHLRDRFWRGAQPVEDDDDFGAHVAGALGEATYLLGLQLLLNRAARKEREARTPGPRAFQRGMKKQLRLAIDNRKNAAQVLGRQLEARTMARLRSQSSSGGGSG